MDLDKGVIGESQARFRSGGIKLTQVYGEFFSENYPARSAIEVARLPKDALIEIEAVAVI